MDEMGEVAFAEGVPCWIDALLPDVEAGKRFYGELFGWTFREGAGPEYEAFRDGELVAALAPKQDGRMPTVWNVYFATPDAYALARRIKKAGGQLVIEPMPIGAFGTMAQAADPEGAVFGLWQAGSLAGFEKKGEPGSFCWTEVYSRDKALVDPFYEGVFGFGGADLGDPVQDAGGDAEGLDFRTWSPAGAEAGPDTAIGGRSLVSGTFPAEMPAHFLIYFNVTDCDATAATAKRLGGRVQAEPFDIPYESKVAARSASMRGGGRVTGGRMAVLIDNQGAVFAVLQD